MAMIDGMKNLCWALFNKKKLFFPMNKDKHQFIFKNSGYCPTCARNVNFVARDAYLRDYYFCSNCASIPRERTLMVVIEMYFPNWRNLTIHESSPSDRGASKRISKECSQYFPRNFSPTKSREVSSGRCAVRTLKH